MASELPQWGDLRAWRGAPASPVRGLGAGVAGASAQSVCPPPSQAGVLAWRGGVHHGAGRAGKGGNPLGCGRGCRPVLPGRTPRPSRQASSSLEPCPCGTWVRRPASGVLAAPRGQGTPSRARFAGGTGGTSCIKAKYFTEMEANLPFAFLGTCHEEEPRQTHFLCYSRVLEGSLTGYFSSLHLVTWPVYSAETWSPHSTEQILAKLF